MNACLFKDIDPYFMAIVNLQYRKIYFRQSCIFNADKGFATTNISKSPTLITVFRDSEVSMIGLREYFGLRKGSMGEEFGDFVAELSRIE